MLKLDGGKSKSKSSYFSIVSECWSSWRNVVLHILLFVIRIPKNHYCWHFETIYLTTLPLSPSNVIPEYHRIEEKYTIEPNTNIFYCWLSIVSVFQDYGRYHCHEWWTGSWRYGGVKYDGGTCSIYEYTYRSHVVTSPSSRSWLSERRIIKKDI